MHFAHPSALLLLLIIPFLIRYWTKRSLPPLINLTLPFERKTAESKLRTIPVPKIQTLIKVISLIFLVIALAQPNSI